jgi:hypothetical protein
LAIADWRLAIDDLAIDDLAIWAGREKSRPAFFIGDISSPL